MDLHAMYKAFQELEEYKGQEWLAEECSVGLSTLKRAANDPGFKGSEATKRRFNEALKHYYPSPFSKVIEAHAESYEEVMAHLPTRKSIIKFLDSFEQLIKNHPEYGAESPDGARLLWISAWCSFDRSRLSNRRSRSEYTKIALELAQHARSILDNTKGKDRDLCHEALKLKLFSFVTYFNGCDIETRMSCHEVRKVALDLDMPSVARELLDHPRDRNNWRIVRNGLVISGIFEDEQSAAFFWRKLQSVHKNFEDPTYQPNEETESISVDPDIKWAYENVIGLGELS